MKHIKILLVLLIIGFTSVASAVTIPDGLYYIYSGIDGHYTIDNSSSRTVNGNNIHLWYQNKTKAQQWRVVNQNGGIVIKSALNTDYVIDDDHSKIYNGNNIQLWQYNGSNAQLWFPQQVGEHRFILRSAINRNFVIDVSGSGMFDGNNIQLWEYNGTNAQVWIFLKVADVEVNDFLFDFLFDF